MDNKKYLQTHPWISFSIPLQDFNFTTWMSLGEAQSKCEHIAGSPILPETWDKMRALYLSKGVNATIAIEGNSLTEEEVLAIIERRSALPKSKEYMEREVKNIYDAFNGVLKGALENHDGNITPEEICGYNRQILSGDEVSCGCAGVYREHSVIAGTYRGAPAEDCPYLVARLCELLNETFAAGSEWKIACGFIKAIVAHLYLVWIHPFPDGNGRTARLVEFRMLLQAGVSAPAAHLLSNHYNVTRTMYYEKLNESTRKASIYPFLEYALTGFIDQLQGQIAWIIEQQSQNIWINHIHGMFSREKPSEATKRRRDLMLYLSKDENGTAIGDISVWGNRTLGKMYASRTPKTLSRDLHVLQDMGFLVVDEGIAKPNTGVLLQG